MREEKHKQNKNKSKIQNNQSTKPNIQNIKIKTYR